MLVVPALAQTGNQSPVAVDDTYAIVKDIATVLTVLGNDTDPNGDTLSINSVSSPAHGSISLSAGTLTYTPTAGYIGADALTYVLSDGHGNTDTGAVNLFVAASIGIPVAQDDTISVSANIATPITVLANDSDPDGQALTITAVTTPSHGTAAITGGTGITYTPTAGYIGADAFAYTVSDGFGSTDTANVVVNVVATVVVNTSTVLTPLANDTDADGDVLTIASVTAPTNGTATITGDAKGVTYTPTAGYVGADAFSYMVIDGHGNSAVGTVTIAVVAQNSLIGTNDAVTTKVDNAKTIAVLENDHASNNANALTVTAVSAPAHGTAVITSDAKKITYTPVGGYIGADTFVYTVTEAGGTSATATVTITIAAKDDDDRHDKDDCKDGGWAALGFSNQGLCIAAANHGIKFGEFFPRGLFPIFGHHDGDDCWGDRNEGVGRDKDDDKQKSDNNQSNVNNKNDDDKQKADNQSNFNKKDDDDKRKSDNNSNVNKSDKDKSDHKDDKSNVDKNDKKSSWTQIRASFDSNHGKKGR